MMAVIMNMMTITTSMTIQERKIMDVRIGNERTSQTYQMWKRKKYGDSFTFLFLDR